MTGIVTRPDQPFLIPGAVCGALHESLNRFVEVRNGGGGDRSCWALASLGQIDVIKRISLNWATMDDVRGDVARMITQGSEQELLERLQGLLHEVESNPGLRDEIREQRNARSEQVWEQRKARPVQAAPGLETLTLAEYASYVQTPMGKGFAGGGLELAALGKLTGLPLAQAVDGLEGHAGDGGAL